MKKIYTLTFFAAIVATNMFSQSPVNYPNGTTSYPNPTSFSGVAVTAQNINNRSAFVIDNTGNKWIGLNSGLSNSFQLLKYNGAQWDTFPAFTSILANNKVNTLAVDAGNNIWIGSNAGLTVYNGTNFTTYNKANSGIVSDTIVSLACGNGTVYAGTNNRGLSVFNGGNFSNYNTSNGLNSNYIKCIAFENPTTVWLGNAAGLQKFNGSSFTFNYVTQNNAAEVINCIYIDAQNNKWLGTDSHGTIKYDNTNFYTMQLLYPANTTQDLLGTGNWPTTVKTICRGPNGGVVFGVSGQGVNGKYISGRTIEITNSQLYYYTNIAIGVPNGSITQPFNIVQYDPISNKLFYTIPMGSTSIRMLWSAILNQSSLQPFDVSYTNSAFLDINNVNALITDNSQQHWDNTSGQTKYFAPKQTNSSPLYASAMWIGGYVNGNDLRVAAMTYRQNGYDFWPGPLDPATAAIDTATALAYNKVWKVNRYDIANFIYNWNAGNVQNNSFTPASAIINWPGNSPYNGQALAPYVDYNNDGTYNYMQGDYPLIKGDQMIWSVYNDNLYKHTESHSTNKLGIEVHASAYAFICPSIADSNVVLNNTTFYNYRIFNRSTDQITQARIGLWMDTDLGNYQDDYIGSDVMNDFGYTYNGDNYDENVGSGTGYNYNLPVFACNILSGPLADAGDGIDNNHNCIVDEAGEKCLMSGFTYYNNTGSSLNGNPFGTAPYYDLMSSKWETGVPMTYGNQGQNTLSASSPACTYVFPGTSDPYGYGLGGVSCSSPSPFPGPTIPWTEGNVPSNPPGDRRFIVNIGPFTMQPGSMSELDYALVFTQDSVNCDSNATCVINRAVQDNKRVKRWFNTNSYPSCLSLVGVGIKQNNIPQLNLKLYPNPANTNVYVEFGSSQKDVTIEVFDMLGKLVRGLQYAELNKYAIIPVSDLQSGVYMVKTTSANGIAITKFIKE